MLRMLAVVACVAAVAPLSAATASSPTPPARTVWMKTPCAQEDSTNCYWNAREQGDGRGHSFYAVTRSGISCHFYVQRRFARRHDVCEKAK